MKKIMNEVEFEKFLGKFEFRKYADIVSNGKHALFENKQAEGIGCGYVYLWVEKDRNKFKIVYVGKAGKTMRKRCNEQVGGFRGGSKVGKTHSNNLLKGIKAGKHYLVYARKSKTGNVVEESNIPFCRVEELAFIQKLEPPWNSIKT
jgi:hypothetical protein